MIGGNEIVWVYAAELEPSYCANIRPIIGLIKRLSWLKIAFKTNTCVCFTHIYLTDDKNTNLTNVQYIKDTNCMWGTKKGSFIVPVLQAKITNLMCHSVHCQDREWLATFPEHILGHLCQVVGLRLDWMLQVRLASRVLSRLHAGSLQQHLTTAATGIPQSTKP